MKVNNTISHYQLDEIYSSTNRSSFASYNNKQINSYEYDKFITNVMEKSSILDIS